MMKMKRKIMAIWMVLILVAIPFSIAQASESQENETISVEIGNVNEEGKLVTETFFLSEEQLAELETILLAITQKIEYANSWEEIEYIIQNIPIKNGIIGTILSKIISIITSSISKITSKFRLFFDRSLIVSCGHSYKLNPFKNSELFRIRKKFVFWHYSNKGNIKDRTIIFKLNGFKLRTLHGRQFGFMRNFFGLYIYIARRIPRKSTTFFMGTARRINVIQLSPS